MADEVVSVGLAADNSSFIKAFNQAAMAVKNVVGAGKFMVNSYTGIVRNMEGVANAIEARFKKMALTVGAAGLGVGIAFHKGLSNFKEFESAMANVHTVSDNSQVSFGKMGDSVMKMTSQFPQSAEELASGLYEIESAGFHGNDALKILADTAKFSTAGLTDMTTSVRATASIMNAYGLQAKDATHVTDVLFKAVEVGQMTAGEFASNIGDWASSAASLQVPFEAASAALATMTTKGAIPANQAATSLSAIFRSLINPSQVMGQTLKRQGFESGKAALQTLGLAGTLNMLWQASGKTETGFQQMFQEAEGFKGALGLVTVGSDMLGKSITEFSNNTLTAGTTQEAFNKQMSTLANKGKLVGNEIRQMGYEVGKIIAPMANFVTGGAAGFLHFLNSAPAPIRTFMAALQLLAPAVAVFGGILATMAIKSFLWSKALTALADAKGLTGFFARMPLVKKAFLSVADAGGPLNFLIKKMQAFALGSDAVRGAMLRTAGTATLYAAGFTLAIVAITSLMSSLSDAKAKANAFRATFVQAGSGGIASMKQLNDQMQRAQDASKSNWSKTGGSGFMNILKGAAQMVTPFTENTVLNHAQVASEADKIAGEYAKLGNAARDMAQATNLSLDDVMAGLSQLASEGTVDIQAVIDATERLRNLRNESNPKNDDITGIGAYERRLKFVKDQYAPGGPVDQLRANVAKSGVPMGPKMDAPVVDPLQFMSAETYNNYIKYKGVLDDAAAALEAFQNKVSAYAAADAMGSAASADFAKALYDIGDAAGTASSKLDAFNTIMGQSLGNTLSLGEAQGGMIDSIEKAGQVMVDNGANFDLTTEAGRNIEGALSAAAKATADYAGEVVRQSGNTNDAIPIVASYVQGMIGVAQQAGFGADQISQMISTMGLTPETIQTLVSLPGIDPAIAQLLTTGSLLGGLDGYVAHAGVQITVAVNTVGMDAETARETRRGAPGGALGGPTAAQASVNSIGDLVKGMLANIPKTLGKKGGGGGGGGKGGGGGGGGGGGAPKWKPNADQLKNMKEALSRPYIDMLTGDLGDVWQKQVAEKWFNTVALNTLSAGKTMLGANILKEAQKSGTDPKDELQTLADDYQRLIKLIGQANADIVVNQTDNLKAFSAYVDGVDAMIHHQQDVEDWKAGRSDINAADYLAILQKRLDAETAFTDEWMAIQDKIKSVQDKIKSDQDEQVAHLKKVMEIQLALGEITQGQYLAYLRQRLAATAKYSDEWYALWQEIDNIEKKVIDDTKSAADAIKNFAKDVRTAFDDIIKSVSDPMLQATSLIKAFGDQTTITQDQVAGFYSHMLEGTQRWVTVIKQLKEKGINKSFLNELIQAGPQSLSFAESILGLGSSGINLINSSMADIASLATGLGTDIATGSVGTLNQNDQSINITVGDITITSDTPGGVTVDQVAAAISTALGGIAVQVGNRTTTATETGAPPATTMDYAHRR